MKRNGPKSLREALDKNPSSYLLITCGEPAEDGRIQVEMTCQGLDAALASYLLQGAQSFIDQEEEDEEEQEVIHSSKRVRLID